MKYGGDIFKFAGDAIIVLFILNDSSYDTPCEHLINQCLRRVIQCSLEIQEKLHLTKLTRDVTLSIKLGISMGPINIINIGGVFSRYEYLPTGTPLLEAFECEGACQQGDIHVTKKV
jgi:adenylate cyclase 10